MFQQEMRAPETTWQTLRQVAVWIERCAPEDVAHRAWDAYQALARWSAHAAPDVQAALEAASATEVLLLVRLLSARQVSTAPLAESVLGSALAEVQQMRVWTPGNVAALVWAVAFSPDGTRLAVALESGIELWRVEDGERLAGLHAQVRGVKALAWSPDGTLLASAGSDQPVQTWSAVTGTRERLDQAHPAPIRALAWSPDGQYLAAGGDHQTVTVWECSGGQRRWHWEAPMRPGQRRPARKVAPDGPFPRSFERIQALAWSSDDLLAFGDEWGQLWVWAMPLDRPPVPLGPALEAPIVGVVWNAASALSALDRCGRLRTWNRATGQEMQTLRLALPPAADARRPYLTAAAWSKTGAALATADGARVRLWHCTSGALLRTFWPSTTVQALDWSPDGAWIAVGGEAVGWRVREQVSWVRTLALWNPHQQTRASVPR